MFENPFDRKLRETDAEYILRLFNDPWFELSTPEEIADFARVNRGTVRQVIMAWAKSVKVRRIHSHATAVAEQIGWGGTPEGLVHTALELLLQRAQQRDRVPPMDIDHEIHKFLAEHRVKSDLPVPPRSVTVLPADTDPGN